MFKKANELEVGVRGSYLWDEPDLEAEKLMEISRSVAMAYCQDIDTPAWPVYHNKEWMVVKHEDSYPHDRWIILYNHDGVFYLYAVNRVES